MYWKMMQSEHKKSQRVSKFINICEKITAPYDLVVSKKGKDGKKKRKTVKGNIAEVLVVVKTTMRYYDEITKIVDTVTNRVLYYEKDAMMKANEPKFGSQQVEIAASMLPEDALGLAPAEEVSI